MFLNAFQMVLLKFPLNGPDPLIGSNRTWPFTSYVPSTSSFGKNTSTAYVFPYSKTLKNWRQWNIFNLKLFCDFNLKSFKWTYSNFLILKLAAPYAWMFLAEMCKPLDLVLSETSKLPTSMGSMLGMSSSGIPFTNDGRSASMLSIMHPFKFGSLLWQICKKSARKR